jgi:hypothetical protein
MMFNRPPFSRPLPKQRPCLDLKQLQPAMRGNLHNAGADRNHVSPWLLPIWQRPCRNDSFKASGNAAFTDVVVLYMDGGTTMTEMIVNRGRGIVVWLLRIQGLTQEVP